MVFIRMTLSICSGENSTHLKIKPYLCFNIEKHTPLTLENLSPHPGVFQKMFLRPNCYSQ